MAVRDTPAGPKRHRAVPALPPPQDRAGIRDQLGRTAAAGFEPFPDPPDQDLLKSPLVLATLPVRLPRESWLGGLSRLLARHRVWPNAGAVVERGRVVDCIHRTAAAVGVRGTAGTPKGETSRGTRVLHPYHLRYAFDLLHQVPAGAQEDARTLELLLGLILRGYCEALAKQTHSRFSFEAEAREYFRMGYRGDLGLAKTSDANDPERRSLIQATYTAYYHARNYYLYALVRRERLSDHTRLFSFNYRAALFMARVDRVGHLLPRPDPRAMPTRRTLSFLAQRHPAVAARLRTDRGFAEQVHRLMKALAA